ncbi:histidine phosphatase family protein [Rhodoferax sp. GW822-FHT02A01]|uniref:histidine phosphatase family protein n=1 Tax=Rhodoferax sp. GW822-FHT02A01 TaxID=3141537 RepID=UPI00315C90C8
MGTLYLVRHGQASLGADNYDNLSGLGQRQSVRLGEYLAHKGLQFDAVYTGSLKRHAQTWAGIAQGMGSSKSLEPTVRTGLNEYNSEAVIRSTSTEPAPRPTTPESVRAHFLRLRNGLQQWAAGSVTPEGMLPYRDFAGGVAEVLAQIRSQHSGNVLLVSSGGPIATAVALTLGTSPEAFVELNMRIRNTALTEFAFTPKRQALLTFNTLPHLDAAPYADWASYS